MSKLPARSPEVTALPRTAEASRAEYPHLNGAGATAGDYAEDEVPRTAHSIRCQKAYRDWLALPPSQRPLAVARGEIARSFDTAMHAHWLAGEEAFSNVAVARACGLDERNVRQWREGEKAIPLAALLVMPATLANEMVNVVRDRRGVGAVRRGLAGLDLALTGLDAAADPEDRDEVMRTLIDAQRRITERIARLATEGR